MKRKSWLKTTLFVLLSLLLSLALIVGFLTVKGYGISVGRLLVTERGDNLLIVENSPIQMSDQSRKHTLFDKYQTGDLLFVIHDGVEETYPARSGAYFAVRLRRGTVVDIPGNVLNELFDLGWIADSAQK